MHAMKGLTKTPPKVRLVVLALWLLLWLAGCMPSGPGPDALTATPSQDTIQELIEIGALEQAAEILLGILEQNPADASAHYQLGQLLTINQPEQAADHLAEAARLDPALEDKVTRLQDALRQAGSIQDPAYHLTVTGQAFSSLEEWALAQAALERAVENDPNYAEAWAYLGEARQHTGQDNSLDALKTAISLDPESYAANLLMSIYWQRNALPKRALPFLQTALRLDPNNRALLEDLAHTQVQAGMVELGFETLEELTAQSPEEAETWMMLARLSIDNSIQVEQVGLPSARQAVLLEPENAAAILMLGRAYLLAEEPVLAERFFLQAMQLDPQMAAPHLYLAIIYLNQENQLPAKSHLQDALLLAEAAKNQAIANQAKKFLEQYFP